MTLTESAHPAPSAASGAASSAGSAAAGHTGARERKKRETARAIEVAAVELAAEHGLSEITIESISAQADVTSRTFFNYYASKEDAVLGNSRAFPPPSLSTLEFQPGRSTLDIVLDSVRDQVSGFDFGSPRFQQKKRAVVLANPQLLAKDFQSLGALEAEYAESIERLLDAEGATAIGDREHHSWAIVMLLGSVLRLAMHDWSHEVRGGLPLAAHIDAARATLLEVSATSSSPTPSRSSHTLRNP